jgi:hypothetical protein
MVPMVLFTLPAGHVADNHERKRIILLMNVAIGVASVGLTLISAFRAPVFWIYACLFVAGTARRFLRECRLDWVYPAQSHRGAQRKDDPAQPGRRV